MWNFPLVFGAGKSVKLLLKVNEKNKHTPRISTALLPCGRSHIRPLSTWSLSLHEILRGSNFNRPRGPTRLRLGSGLKFPKHRAAATCRWKEPRLALESLKNTGKQPLYYLMSTFFHPHEGSGMDSKTPCGEVGVPTARILPWPLTTWWCNWPAARLLLPHPQAISYCWLSHYLKSSNGCSGRRQRRGGPWPADCWMQAWV